MIRRRRPKPQAAAHWGEWWPGGRPGCAGSPAHQRPRPAGSPPAPAAAPTLQRKGAGRAAGSSGHAQRPVPMPAVCGRRKSPAHCRIHNAITHPSVRPPPSRPAALPHACGPAPAGPAPLEIQEAPPHVPPCTFHRTAQGETRTVYKHRIMSLCHKDSSMHSAPLPSCQTLLQGVLQGSLPAPSTSKAHSPLTSLA